MDDNGHQMDIGEDDGDPMDDGDYAYDSWKDKQHDIETGNVWNPNPRREKEEDRARDMKDEMLRGGEDGLGIDGDSRHDRMMDYDEDIGNDEHMDTEPPESGVATPVGMTNLAGEPTMDEDKGGDVGGPGATAMGGMGTGSPYVGDMAMDADPELENMMMSRELGEASIHMFRNETDESLSALVEVLGLTEMNDWDDDPGQITLEVYEEATDSYKDVNLDVSWQIEPTEYDGQFISYQGSASVDGIQLDKPVRVNGKVYHKMDEELAALILATQGQGHTSLSDYITDTYADKIDLPQHKYPDSTR
jgi:hypothetical protein